MKRYFSHIKIKIITWVIIVLILVFSVFMTDVSKEQAPTIVSVEPSDQTVGQATELLPTSPFTINITVDNVADLYAWEIVLYYNSSILDTKSDWVIIPEENNIFKGLNYLETPKETRIGSDNKGTFIQLGATILGDQTSSGSGILCQINFTGEAKGTSLLILNSTTDIGDFSTSLYGQPESGWDEPPPIPFDMVNGKVTVVGAEKITISVEPSVVAVGSNATVSGDTILNASGVNVAIFHRVLGSEIWGELATVSTDVDGHYIYTWNTSEFEANFYEFKANYTAAESAKVRLTIKKASKITVEVNPKSVSVGSNVNIEVNIFEINKNTTADINIIVNTTIFYKTLDEEVWHELAQVKPTVRAGNYVYSWTTDKTGLYEVKASWPGAELIFGGESNVETIEVTEAAPPPETLDIMPYLPYIAGGLGIIGIAIAAIYFTKIRKR